MNDVSAIVKDSADVLRVYRAREVRITMVGAMLLGVSPRRLLRNLEEIISDEVFGSSKLFVGALVDLRLSFRGKHVVDKLWEIFI